LLFSLYSPLIIINFSIIKNLTNQPDKYPPISAYEYLKWRLAQSYVDNEYIDNEEVGEDGKQHLPENQKYK